MIRGALVTYGTRHHRKTRKRQIGIHATGRRQAHNELDSCSVQLFRNQHGIRTAYRSRNDPAVNALKFQCKHRGVEACPSGKKLCHFFLHKPVRQVPIKIEYANRRDDLVLESAISAHLFHQRRGGESGWLLKSVVQDRKGLVAFVWHQICLKRKTAICFPSSSEFRTPVAALPIESTRVPTSIFWRTPRTSAQSSVWAHHRDE